MTLQAFVLRGPFSDADLQRFVALMREIDAGNPDGCYELCAVDSEGTALESAERLNAALPDTPGRETTWTAYPSDPSRWAAAFKRAMVRTSGAWWWPDVEPFVFISALFHELAQPEKPP